MSDKELTRGQKIVATKKARYGNDFFVKQGQRTAAKMGKEHYQQMGRLGGLKTKEMMPFDYFMKLGKKSVYRAKLKKINETK